MNNILPSLDGIISPNPEIYKPQFYRLNNENDITDLRRLIDLKSIISVYDTLYDQLKELLKGRNPSVPLSDDDYPALIEKHLNGCTLEAYGVWVFYPWSGRLVHMLDEEEFIEVRTSRNNYKITREEQSLLRSKKIAIIGLSIGQTIALALSIERICGALRLADFDTLELSNMNRIRTGVHNLGVRKVVMTAREIAEIDPFLNVVLYTEGITEENINDFFTQGGLPDLLVEECDSLDIKILARYKARSLRIPVIMDTSDRGMLDVERFDLEPDRPLLHGLAGDINPALVRGLTNEEKVPFVMKIVGFANASERLKFSMGEIRKTITTWPQLASSVFVGGAIAADVSRRILLDQFHESGRYYMDPEEQIADKKSKGQQD